jgi:hypothetical protein
MLSQDQIFAAAAAMTGCSRVTMTTRVNVIHEVLATADQCMQDELAYWIQRGGHANSSPTPSARMIAMLSDEGARRLNMKASG